MCFLELFNDNFGLPTSTQKQTPCVVGFSLEDLKRMKDEASRNPAAPNQSLRFLNYFLFAWLLVRIVTSNLYSE